ncbi:aminopeptidase P N-terminal domain-containing protein [Candidatus Dependentiae bacterium]|nr:aminopeptidase P N-terminal domain-containing protein [Candidatus Dependentiae bacterium]
MLNDIFSIIDNNENTKDASLKYRERRKRLWELVEEEYPEKDGKIVLFSPIESGMWPFVQESSFYYFTGLSQAANVLTVDKQQESILYQPDFGELREKWIGKIDLINEQTVSLFGIDKWCTLGLKMQDYQVYPYFSMDDYQEIIAVLKHMIAQKQTIFTLYPCDKYQYVSVKFILDRLTRAIPELMQYVIDISCLVARMRRKKDIAEIEMIYQAVEITSSAYQAAARILQPGVNESELQAAIEYIFTENRAYPAYASIVAGANNATILHYTQNNKELQKGELVLIDAGAKYRYYCADITRVFPVSGKFSKRQKELYEIVLATQRHVVDHVRPGMWLVNAKEQDRSLQHIALNFLKKHGYDSYFAHGIGHYLGLDVHDVGSRNLPLQEGDVITIEPGVYLSNESIGIRIEDNYWVVADAEPVCLSESIPKELCEVENMVKERF